VPVFDEDERRVGRSARQDALISAAARASRLLGRIAFRFIADWTCLANAPQQHARAITGSFGQMGLARLFTT